MHITVKDRQVTRSLALTRRAKQAGRHIFRRAIIALLAAGLMSGTATAQSDLETRWQTVIDETRTSAKLIGFGGAVMIDGEIVARGASGVQRKGGDSPITTANKWHVGSITKPMTATMIARLVEAGEMNWTDTPGKIFKDMEIDPAWGEVTLEHLLTHTSGAAPNMPMKDILKWPETAEATRAARLDVIRRTLSKAPPKTPGKSMSYSNLGYTIAGGMAEQATGKNWEELMREQVFTPLGLESAGFGPPEGTDATPEPWGHRKIMFVKLKLGPEDEADNSPIMGPAGTVHMSADDILTFGNTHLQGLKGQSDYLKPETFQKLHTPRLDDYAYGWVEYGEREWANGPISWHNGSNTMWYGFLVFAPEKNTVVFTGTNDGGGVSAEGTIVKRIADYVAEID